MPRPDLIAVLLCAAAIAAPAAAQEAGRDVARDEAQRLIATLDYLAGDYTEAVAAEGGKVLNRDEYVEMNRFAARIDELMRALRLERSDLYPLARQIAALVVAKASLKKIEAACGGLREGLLAKFAIPTHPDAFPDRARGREIYLAACAVCHGADGRAATPLAAELDPPPRAFADPTLMDRLSPYKAFNGITFGVDGTAMPSFAALDEADRWSVAAYLFTLREGLPPPRARTDPLMHWSVAMRTTDGDIRRSFETSGLRPAAALEELSQIRNLYYVSEAPVAEPTADAGVPSHRLSALEHVDFALVKGRAAGVADHGIAKNERALRLLAWWPEIPVRASEPALRAARTALLAERRLAPWGLYWRVLAQTLICLAPMLVALAALHRGKRTPGKTRIHPVVRSYLFALGGGALGIVLAEATRMDPLWYAALASWAIPAAILAALARGARPALPDGALHAVAALLGAVAAYPYRFYDLALRSQFLKADRWVDAFELGLLLGVLIMAWWATDKVGRPPGAAGRSVREESP